MTPLIENEGIRFLISLTSLIIVTGFHEFAHAYTATLFGDPTPKYQGRVTLNPLKHIDPVGLLMIFLIQFGWGKPVQINPYYFKNPRQHEAIVAVAGPMMNFLIAVVCATILKLGYTVLSVDLRYILENLIFISVTLLAFNMLPFPPLDGSKFVQLLIPDKLHRPYALYLANGSMYFFAFMLIDNFILGRYFNFSILSSVIRTISQFIYSIIYFGT